MDNYKKHLKTIVTWALLGLLLLLWVQFILFPKHKANSIEAVTAPPTQIANNQSLPKLSSYSIFGASSVSDIPLDLLQSESSLELIITGIFSSNDPQQGRAYIRNLQGDEKKFKVGDDVFGLAKLAAIYDDHLVLSRNGGQREKLSLSKGADLTAQTRTNKSNSTNEKAAVNAAATERLTKHIKGADDWQATLNQQKFDPSKIAKIASNVQVVHDAGGQVAGLRVSQLATGSDLMKLGLRANDQIVAVNGVDISYQNVLSIQKQLQSNADVNVTVMRNGRKMNLNLNLSEFQ